MKFEQDTILKILLEGSYITDEDVIKAKEYAEEHRVSPTDYLLVKELTSTDIIGQAIAESLKVSYSNLEVNPPSKEQVLLIPEKIAKKFHVVVLVKIKEKWLLLPMIL